MLETGDGLLLVLGMHRSGTSALARICHLLGADLGGEVLAPQAGVNDAGFWEHKALVELDEAVLAALGLRWFDIQRIVPAGFVLPVLTPLKARARALLESDFTGGGLGLLKDPRLSRLLPLWLPILDQLGKTGRMLLVLRSPEAVANSLARRDGFDLTTGRVLWLRHVLEAERATRGQVRAFVDYDAMLSEPEIETKRLIKELSLEMKTPGVAELRAVLPESLRHHRGEATAPRCTLAELAAGVYRTLTAAIRRGENPAVELNQAAVAFDELCERWSDPLQALQRTNRALVSARVQLSELGEQHAVALATVAERDRQLEHAGEVVRARDQQLVTQNAELARVGAALAHASAVVVERDGQLQSANTELSRLGQDLAHATGTVDERDRQLLKANAERERVGGELGHAVAVVEARDRQLAQANAECSRLGAELGHAMSVAAQRDRQLDRLRTSWFGPLVRRMINEDTK
jgi:hypothetical protein